MQERTLFRLYVFTHTASGIEYYSATSKIDKEPWTSLSGRLQRRASRNSSRRTKLLQKTIGKHHLADSTLQAIKKKWSVVAYEDLFLLEEVDAIIDQAIQNDTNYHVLNTLSKAGGRLRAKETPTYLNVLKSQALLNQLA